MPSDNAAPGMSSTPSIRPISHSCLSGLTGAKPTPQLPITIVVTPCQHVGVSSGSHVTCPSKCVCTSTKPGVTSAPSAGTVSRARPSTAPTSVMTPSVIATSAVRAGAPVPSTTEPPLMTRSCTGLPQILEEEALYILHEEIGLLERGEVSTAVEPGVAREIEPGLGVRLGNAEHLLREHRRRRGGRDVLPHRSEAVAPLRLAVETNRRVDRLGHPVDGKVGEQLIARDGVVRTAVVVGPGVELLDDPARETRRRISEAVAECLRVLALDLLVRG